MKDRRENDQHIIRMFNENQLDFTGNFYFFLCSAPFSVRIRFKTNWNCWPPMAQKWTLLAGTHWPVVEHQLKLNDIQWNVFFKETVLAIREFFLVAFSTNELRFFNSHSFRMNIQVHILIILIIAFMCKWTGIVKWLYSYVLFRW